MASIDETGPLIGGLLSQVPDIDPGETGEWIESLDGLIAASGDPRARYVLMSLLRHARQQNVAIPVSMTRYGPLLSGPAWCPRTDTG